MPDSVMPVETYAPLLSVGAANVTGTVAFWQPSTETTPAWNCEPVRLICDAEASERPATPATARTTAATLRDVLRFVEAMRDLRSEGGPGVGAGPRDALWTAVQRSSRT